MMHTLPLATHPTDGLGFVFASPLSPRNSSAAFSLRLRGSPGGNFTLKFTFFTSGWPPLATASNLVSSAPIQMTGCNG